MLVSSVAAGKKRATLAGDNAAHTRVRIAADCFAGISLNADGIEYAFSAAGSATGSDLGRWRLSGGAFWVRATLNSGVLDGANSGVGSWLALTSTRSWAITRPTDGTDLADVDIDIAADSGGATILASANYTLSATRETA